MVILAVYHVVVAMLLVCGPCSAYPYGIGRVGRIKAEMHHYIIAGIVNLCVIAVADKEAAVGIFVI